ncbi:MAG: hypothetical protein AMXMBFR84_11560 [Candidatus Hydrogenedentota bacterium]
MSYPPTDLPHSCQASLWIAQQAFPARSMEYIYDLPLYTDNNSGLLDVMYDFLEGTADYTYVSQKRNKEIRDSIDVFRGENTAGDKIQTIKQMLRTGKRRSNANPGSKTLSGFLRVMLDSGIYFANNHTNLNKVNEVKALLDGTDPYDTPLWDMTGSIEGGPQNIRFGSLTYEQLFNTQLRKLDKTLFRAVRRAKRLSVLWCDVTQRYTGDPGGSIFKGLPDDIVKKGGDGNDQCCYNGACITSEFPGDYCGQIDDGTGTGTFTCNALSDPCH